MKTAVAATPRNWVIWGAVGYFVFLLVLYTNINGELKAVHEELEEVKRSNTAVAKMIKEELDAIQRANNREQKILNLGSASINALGQLDINIPVTFKCANLKRYGSTGMLCWYLHIARRWWMGGLSRQNSSPKMRDILLWNQQQPQLRHGCNQ